MRHESDQENINRDTEQKECQGIKHDVIKIYVDWAGLRTLKINPFPSDNPILVKKGKNAKQRILIA
jgi:hypothetical protein